MAPIRLGLVGVVRLDFTDAAQTPISATFDWRQTGPQTWDIRVGTDRGTLVLSSGGSRMSVDGRSMVEAPEAEYPGIYRHVADAFLLGRRVTVEDFHDTPT